MTFLAASKATSFFSTVDNAYLRNWERPPEYSEHERRTQPRTLPVGQMGSSSFPENFSELFHCSDYTRIAREAERKVPTYRAMPRQNPFRVRMNLMAHPVGRARLPDLSWSADR